VRFSYGLIAGAALTLNSQAWAQQTDHESVNEANNPLTPKITINLQDYYIPSFYGASGYANQFLFRGLLPWKLGDHGQLFRFTLPLATAPGLSGYDTGLGDTTLMNLTPMPVSKDLTLAFGPILVAPTATSSTLGSGRWQLGAAGVVIAPQSWGLLGGLATYQHSFANDFGRAPVNLLTIQPIVNINLPDRYYIRSSGIWNFDLQNRNSYIPVGLGLGRVFLLDGGITANAFIEPQWTAWHDGDGAPKWQIFGGINFQFPIH